MDTKIAQKRVNDLSAAMVAKGMASPRAHLNIKSHEQPTAYMSWTDKSTTYGEAYHVEVADTPFEALEKAAAFVAAQPTPEQARLNEFLRSLGKVIDLGRANNIEVEFLNPLVATMKTLSENVITDQRAA